MQRKFHIPVMLVLFLTAAAIEAVRLTSLSAITNGDLWWHLSSGLWILQNHRLPHSGIYSQAVSSAWTPVSWAYDVLLAGLYRGMELGANPALLMCFKSGLAVVTFLLAGGMRGKFWSAVILSGIAQYVLGGMQPSPAYFSVIFFAVELLVIFESRKRPRALYWLVPLFLLWANLDEQFVYGIGVIVVYVAISAVQRAVKGWATGGRSSGAQVSGKVGSLHQGASNGPCVEYWTHSLAALITAAGAIIVASLMTPSLHRPYTVFVHSVAGAAKDYLPDFKAMSFHQPQDYVLLLLTMGAFVALGRRQSRDTFQILLLCLAAMLSFYAQRNAWIVALAAVAIIGDAVPSGPAAERELWGWHTLAMAGVTLVLLASVVIAVIPRRRDVLLAKVAEGYPVAASNYIREHRLPEPLFNAYEWGGFLTWYLPEYPVAIDGRTGLYGDDFIILYSKAMNAEVPYTAFPAMAQARTLVFPKTSVLGEALSTVAGFKVAYSDDVGLVLIREDETAAGN